MKDDAIAQFDTLNPHDYFYLTRFDYRTEFRDDGDNSRLMLELRREPSPDSPRLIIEFRGVRDLQFSGDVSCIGIVIESTEGRQWEESLYRVSDDERIGVVFYCQSFEARIEA